jgi:hypothetical protein
VPRVSRKGVEVIVITGTKRSGTSLWMRILEGAGYPLIGEAFPGDWQKVIGKANPDGFYESVLRFGVCDATDPRRLLQPSDVQQHAVKIFVPGLLRTGRRYFRAVIACMRDWREYVASIERFYALEDEGAGNGNYIPAAERMQPELEWWWENYSMITDAAARAYPIHIQSFDGLLEAPSKVIGDTLRWLGGGDAASAARRVTPSRRTFSRPEVSSSLEPEVLAVFDELYEAIGTRGRIGKALLGRMEDTQHRLWPAISAELLRTRRKSARPPAR